MGTSVKGRSFPTQQIHYLRSRFTAAQIGSASTAVLLGTLPAGALRQGDAIVQTITAFTDNHQLQIGSSGSPTMFASAVTLSGGVRAVLTQGAHNPLTADMDVYVMLTSQSTAGAVGIAVGVFEVVLPYTPPNDNLDRTTQYDAN